MASVLIFAFAIRWTCSGLATATLATYGARISVTAVALPVASTTTWSLGLKVFAKASK
jgi:hypothetical protein